jgi:hypothetical protein
MDLLHVKRFCDMLIKIFIHPKICLVRGNLHSISGRSSLKGLVIFQDINFDLKIWKFFLFAGAVAYFNMILANPDGSMLQQPCFHSPTRYKTLTPKNTMIIHTVKTFLDNISNTITYIC